MTSRNGSQPRSMSVAGLMPARPHAWPCGVELIRRRADLQRGKHKVLVPPGIESVGADTDGEIEIEPDRQPGATGLVAARGELPVGDPLHERDIVELVGIGCAQTGKDVCRAFEIHSAIPPWPAEAPAQHLECRERCKQCSALMPEGFELPPPRLRWHDVKDIESETERARLARSRRLRSRRTLAARGASMPESKFAIGSLWKFGNGLDVDIERIEEIAGCSENTGLLRRGGRRTGRAAGSVRSPAAPSDAAMSIRSARSVKSPWPQLRCERTP